MFFGDFKKKRNISLGNQTTISKEQLLVNNLALRRQREQIQKQQSATLLIQKVVLDFIIRQRIHNQLRLNQGTLRRDVAALLIYYRSTDKPTLTKIKKEFDFRLVGYSIQDAYLIARFAKLLAQQDLLDLEYLNKLFDYYDHCKHRPIGEFITSNEIMTKLCHDERAEIALHVSLELGLGALGYTRIILTQKGTLGKHLPVSEILDAALVIFTEVKNTELLELFCNVVEIVQNYHELTPDINIKYMSFLTKALSRLPDAWFSQLNQDETIDDEDGMIVDTFQFSSHHLLTFEYLCSSQHVLRLLSSDSNLEITCESLATLNFRFSSKKIEIQSVILYTFDHDFPQKLLTCFLNQNTDTFKHRSFDSSQWSMLALFCELFSRLLATMSNDEFFKNPTIPLSQLIQFTYALKVLAFNIRKSFLTCTGIQIFN